MTTTVTVGGRTADYSDELAAVLALLGRLDNRDLNPIVWGDRLRQIMRGRREGFEDVPADLAGSAVVHNVKGNQ